jgi:hypothetical protein
MIITRTLQVPDEMVAEILKLIERRNYTLVDKIFGVEEGSHLAIIFTVCCFYFLIWVVYMYHDSGI